jgi:hypothetical protein
MTRTVPTLWRALRTEGFHYTHCADPEDWYLKGGCGLWVGLFIYSKIPELIDTLFLVLQQKKVIFLHWFHHVTVLLYCWHAFHHRIATGLWFAAMNYSVHSVMYLYYFLAGFGMRHIASLFAQYITTIQLLQMFLGAYVTASATLAYGRGEKCAVDPANSKLGLGMYLSYFWLFGLLFYDKYFRPKRQAPTKKIVGSVSSETLCGVELPEDQKLKGM